MRTRGATFDGPETDWTPTDLDLRDPLEGEVLVQWAYGGLCMSDEHARCGMSRSCPTVGGHEGAGVVVGVGPRTSHLAVGDHVVASFIPVCGRCHWCGVGRSSLCDAAAHTAAGTLANGMCFRGGGREYHSAAGVGSFAAHSVVMEGSCVKIDQAIPLEQAVFASCGLLTGWGSAVRAGEVRPGETVMVIGAGGVGIGAVIGAASSGAARVIAVDPFESKLEVAAQVGATETFANVRTASRSLADAFRGTRGADVVIVATTTLDSKVVGQAMRAVGKGGRVVVASMTHRTGTIRLPGLELVGAEKRLIGTLYGSCNPRVDIPLVLGLAVRGRIPLQRLTAATYPLDGIGHGYRDLLEGRITRGVLAHDA